MGNWGACGCVVVGLKQPKVAVSDWLYTIHCFAQCEGIFSLATLDQHLAVTSSWIYSRSLIGSTHRHGWLSQLSPCMYAWCDWCDVTLIPLRVTWAGMAVAGIIIETIRRGGSRHPALTG